MKDKSFGEQISELWARVRTRLTWSPRLEFPAWRWAKNFEWISRTQYDGRAICLRNRSRQKLFCHLGIDTERNETKFQPNRFKSAKYTLLTFLPLNVIEQFRRGANFYFLVTLILTWVIDSPISPESWLMSLAFVVIITMAKQGYEDYLRHKEDNRANSLEVSVVMGEATTASTSMKIKVGDIIHLEEDMEVPCDCIVLTTTHQQVDVSYGYLKLFPRVSAT